MTDVYAALPSITGKFEMEYEGELKGADNVARELIRASVANVFAERFDGVDMRRVIEWFDLGGSLQTADTSSAKELLAQARGVQGLVELADHLQLGREGAGAGARIGRRLRRSKGCTRRRRSAAAKIAAITPPSSRSAARRRAPPSGTSTKGCRCRAGRRSTTTRLVVGGL